MTCISKDKLPILRFVWDLISWWSKPSWYESMYWFVKITYFKLFKIMFSLYHKDLKPTDGIHIGKLCYMYTSIINLSLIIIIIESCNLAYRCLNYCKWVFTLCPLALSAHLYQLVSSKLLDWGCGGIRNRLSGLENKWNIGAWPVWVFCFTYEYHFE